MRADSIELAGVSVKEACEVVSTATSMFGVMRPPRCLVFGAEQRASLSRYARGLGTHALIVTDERVAGDALFREMMAALSASGVRATVYSGTIAELPSTCITEDKIGWTAKAAPGVTRLIKNN
jgi:hypothetical protein